MSQLILNVTFWEVVDVYQVTWYKGLRISTGFKGYSWPLTPYQVKNRFFFFFAVFLSCYPQLKKCVFVICSHKFNNYLKLMFPKQPSSSTEREMTVKLKSEISEVNFSYLYGITRTVQLLLAGTFGQSIYTALFFRNGQITFFFFF